MSTLLLLDVNGLLGCKIDERIEGSIGLNSYNFIFRPRVVELLEVLSRSYSLAIYSSTSYPNLNIILKDIKKYFLFIADRNCTDLDPEYGKVEGIAKYDTVKKIKRVLKHPLFNADRKWNENNVIVVDHDLKKLRFNDDNNIVVVQEYNYSSTSSTLSTNTDYIEDIIVRINSKTLLLNNLL